VYFAFDVEAVLVHIPSQRNLTGGSGGLHAGKRTKTIDSIGKILTHNCVVIEALAENGGLHGQYVGGIEPRGNYQQPAQAAQQKARANQKRQGKRNFGHDQQPSQAVARHTSAAAHPLLQGIVHVGFRPSIRGREARNDTGEQRNSNGE
jgi:hypothetical protein